MMKSSSSVNGGDSHLLGNALEKAAHESVCWLVTGCGVNTANRDRRGALVLHQARRIAITALAQAESYPPVRRLIWRTQSDRV